MKILYFSQVPWSWIRQRPHLLPEALSGLGHEVTFFSIATGGYTSNFKNGNFIVKEIHGIRGSAKYSLSRIINGALCKRALAGARYDAVILTYPFQYAFLPEDLKKGNLIYDCMDLVPDFYREKVKRFMETRERELCARADGVIASSGFIEDQLKRKYGIEEGRLSLIRNAVSPEALRAETSHGLELKTRNAVYAGTIDWWIDFDAIYRFCDSHKDFFIYMIGPICAAAKSKAAEAPGNVIFTGAMEHEAALDCIKRANAALIPFIVTDLIKGVDPVKLYEYLAIGTPVVSSFWPELEHFGSEGIQYYSDYETFETALLSAERTVSAERKEFLTENSWDDRARKLEAAIHRAHSKIY